MKNLCCSLLLLFFFSGYGQNIPQRPSPPRLVNDYSDILTPDQESHLEQKLVAYDDSTSIQIVVVTVTTLDDYDAVDYAVKLGRDWGVGNKKTNNGVVLLISTEEGRRKVFIAPGYGLEGAIPDITAKSIIDNEIVPQFRQENYYRGINQGVDAIIEASRGEYTAPEGYRKKGDKGGGGGLVFIIILIVIFLILRGGGRGPRGGMMSRRGYRRRGLGSLWPLLFLPRGGGGSGWSGGGGGWSGGGGGGGFGGFGGGSFGGGGAGGSW